MKTFSWPLNTNNFGLIDRLKICAFFLNYNNFWTQDKYVKEYEKKMADFVMAKYAVFCSSGSTANTILAMYLKDTLKESNPQKRNVILPAVTWQTSCSPFIREGFNPIFIDVDLKTLGMDMEKLENYLKESDTSQVACIFATSLLGFNPDVDRLRNIAQKYNVKVFLDNCESNFGHAYCLSSDYDNHPFAHFTSTTSTYFGHMLQSCEGGFLFTNDESEYEHFLMYRNHGMTKSLIDQPSYKNYHNEQVDYRFDFYNLGNNFRNTDVHAKIGLLDFERRFNYINSRNNLYEIFKTNININRYYLPYNSLLHFYTIRHVPFAIPIILKGECSFQRKKLIVNYCLNNNIEFRPLISGFLGYHTPYKKYMDPRDYPTATFLHENAMYVGLHSKVKEKNVIRLINFLNKI